MCLHVFTLVRALLHSFLHGGGSTADGDVGEPEPLAGTSTSQMSGRRKRLGGERGVQGWQGRDVFGFGGVSYETSATVSQILCKFKIPVTLAQPSNFVRGQARR